MRTDHNPIIDVGGDKNGMNKLTHYCGRSSGVIGDKGGLDDKGVTKIEQDESDEDKNNTTHQRMSGQSR